jgi:hypothetical protein
VATARARVRTDPPDLPVLLDGRPIDGPEVEFPIGGSPAVLTTTQACRTVERPLTAADAGGEVVLVPDPVTIEVTVDPRAPEAVVSLNGEEEQPTPATFRLDLCSSNRLDLRAPRYRPAILDLPAEIGPLEARTRLAELELEPIPLGTVRLPRGPVPFRALIDGQPVASGSDVVELEVGPHTMRVVSEPHWIDVTTRFEVEQDREVVPLPSLPSLAKVRVQSFPPDCRVSMRKGEGKWRYVSNTPLQFLVAAGRYAVRVEAPSGVVADREVDLSAGDNPPVRVSLAGDNG